MTDEGQDNRFWIDPPWADGEGGYRMALRPIATQRWCSTPITPDQQSAKLDLLRHNFAAVVQTSEGSLPAQHLLEHAVAARQPQRPPDWSPSEPQRRAAGPLVVSALRVPADLCLLQDRGDGDYVLTAGCVTAPSYWRLADKIGRTLLDIHRPVPGLTQALGARMNAFFAGLPERRCFERRNWFIHESPELFQPTPEARRQLNTAAQALKLVVRSETQTLRRLDQRTLVFTIEVQCHALKHIQNHPHAATTLLAAIRSRNADERLAAGQSMWETAVCELLTSVAKEHAH